MEEEDEKPHQFHEMGLDDRILKAVAKLGWCTPTLIQEKAIPLILEGKDVLAKGRTGSGKTGAFVIPLVQKILEGKKTNAEQSVKALLLAPTRELAAQIHQAVVDLTRSCGRVVRCVDVSSSQANASLEAQKPLLVGDLPDIVVGTPSRILGHMKAGHLKLEESLEMMVIDEADLIFSFGHENDLRGILAGGLPTTYQAVLTSATLTEDVTRLKKLVLHNPVSLKLEEPSLPDSTQLTQYKIMMEQEDKFVLIYALFKLRLIQGKTIIFVNNVDKCYQTKLYLEQFGIPVCVLNSELPTASRCHIVSQFNKGVYDAIVASDEKFLMENNDSNQTRDKDKESGVARGIDFQFVSNVINFDFPPDVDSYIHRVGRTARGNNKGTALSLIAARELERANQVEEHLREKEGLGSDSDDSVFKPYQFKIEELDGFKYRAMDAWRSVTRIAVREARLKEIRQEILNSAQLQAHLADNPKDAKVLRHDKSLHTVKHQPQLRNVPDYIVPHSLRNVSRKRSDQQQKRPFKHKGGVSKAKHKYQQRQADPLKALVSKGKRNKR